MAGPIGNSLMRGYLIYVLALIVVVGIIVYYLNYQKKKGGKNE